VRPASAANIRPARIEAEEGPRLVADAPVATPHVLDARSLDPTRGRKVGSDPYDDPTQGRKVGSDPYDDPTRGRL
jgi:hypothetical protein